MDPEQAERVLWRNAFWDLPYGFTVQSQFSFLHIAQVLRLDAGDEQAAGAMDLATLQSQPTVLVRQKITAFVNRANIGICKRPIWKSADCDGRERMIR